MPTAAADARALLRVPPDQYVAERARLAKQAKSDGDRDLASFYQSLKRPNLAMWAALAAGEDPDAVNGVITATTKLAEIQAGGAGSGALSAATRDRRKALETLVDGAVTALAQFAPGAEARRAEIRDIVDQLSRHADLAGAWIDATLREQPDDAFGFAAFSELPETAPRQRDTTKSTRANRPAKKSTSAGDDSAAQRSAERAARAERAEQTRQARKDVAAAARELATAERRVAVARSALREAEKEMKVAEGDRTAAEQQHEEATGRLEASRDD
jgi:chromosome segregation ATPase